MRSSDLAPSFNQQPPPSAGYRQGRVVAWNPITAQNIINVGGTLLVDVPILNTAEAGILTPGDVVGLITTGEGAKSVAIIGRLTIPNTPQAGSALSAWAARGKLATAAGFFSFSSGTYVAASDGLGPTISDFVVGNSGQALVFITAELGSPGGSPVASESKGVYMGIDVSGPTNIAPDDARSLEIRAGWLMGGTATAQIGAVSNASKMVPLTGLAAGTYTIDARYRTTGAGSAAVQQRGLFAVPL